MALVGCRRRVSLRGGSSIADPEPSKGGSRGSSSPVLSPLPKWAREPGARPIPGYRLIEPLGGAASARCGSAKRPAVCSRPSSSFPSQETVAAPIRNVKPFSASRRSAIPLSVAGSRRGRGRRPRHRHGAGRQKPVRIARRLPEARSARHPARRVAGLSAGSGRGAGLDEFRHGLQHLDIKPHNLFVVSNHVKVADFGLVDNLERRGKKRPVQRQGGITPLYAAPELLRGNRQPPLRSIQPGHRLSAAAHRHRAVLAPEHVSADAAAPDGRAEPGGAISPKIRW